MRSWILGLAFIGLFLPGIAQKQQHAPVLTGCPAGFYIGLDRMLPVATGYDVFRRESSDGAWQLLGRYLPCNSSAMLQQRMTRYAGILPDYSLPKKKLADTLWSMYRGANNAKLLLVPLPPLQLALGNSFLDTTAQLGKTYQYRFVFTDSAGATETTAMPYTVRQPVYEAMRLQEAVPGSKRILLQWQTGLRNPPPFFEVYRRQAGGIAPFVKIPASRGLRKNDKGDSVILIAIDSSILQSITYDYFIVSKDYLGNTGNHSDTVRMQAGERSLVPAIRHLRTRPDTSGIRLSWSALKGQADLRNIIVLRSNSYDTGYLPVALLPTTDTIYVDKAIKGGRNYYYQLIVEGSFLYSLPTPRTSGMFTGPVNLLPPYALEARAVGHQIDVQWRFSGQEDISGFKVYRSSSPQLAMQLVGSIPSTGQDTALLRFTDTTVAGGSATYYYAVTAVSLTSSQSPFSQIVTVTRNANSVASPGGLRYLWLNDSIASITWRDLQREVAGIAAYRVYRKTKETEAFSEKHFGGETTLNEYSDTLQPGETRWYAIRAYNGNGQLSALSPVISVTAPLHKPLPPAAVRASRHADALLLNWDGTINGNISEYHIYKAENTGKPVLLASINAPVAEVVGYADKAIKAGRVYFYYITAVTAKKIESDRSEEISVRIK